MHIIFCNSHLDQAKSLSYLLLNKKIVACVNVIRAVESYYWWDNEIVQDSEALLLIKTTDELVLDVIDFINQNHSYDTVEILAVKIDNANQKYIDWLDRVTC